MPIEYTDSFLSFVVSKKEQEARDKDRVKILEEEVKNLPESERLKRELAAAKKGKVAKERINIEGRDVTVPLVNIIGDEYHSEKLDLESMDFTELTYLRERTRGGKEIQEELAPYEHRSFAREMVKENMLWTGPLSLTIPAYQISKHLGIAPKFGEDDPTPPDWKQLEEGFKGVKEGLIHHLSPRLKELFGIEEKPTD